MLQGLQMTNAKKPEREKFWVEELYSSTSTSRDLLSYEKRLFLQPIFFKKIFCNKNGLAFYWATF